MIATLGLSFLLLAPPPASLDEVKREPDLPKRAERAIEFAGGSIKRAQAVVKREGYRENLDKALKDTLDAIGLALESLHQTGKPARKLTRQYKKGELRTREYVRQLNDLANALSIDDRPAAEKARDQMQVFHEEFLLAVMGGK
jgi:hypothetical protein